MTGSDWTIRPLGDLLDFSSGKAIAPGGTGQFPAYGSNGLIGASQKSLFSSGIVIGRVGAYCGSVVYSPNCFWASDNTLVARPKNDTIDARFIYLLLQAAKLNRWAGGSAQPLLTQSVLKPLEFPVPPPEKQRRIASILFAYDDLIEVNRRRVVVLEEMARRLFEEWFVHLRFPGHETVLVHDAPDGPLPESWNVGVLGDLFTLHRGYDLSSSARRPGTVPVITGSGRSGTHDTYKIAAPGVVTGRSGTIGSVYMVHENFWPLNTALYVSSFNDAGPIYALHLLRALKLQKHAGGAAVPTLNRNHVHALPVLKPPSKLLQKFEEVALPFLRQARQHELQNEVLATARDLLLPRLISGELSVADAPAPERFLEAAD